MYEQLAFDSVPKPDEEQSLVSQWRHAKEMQEYWREVQLELEDRHFKMNAGRVALEALAVEEACESIDG
nr:MAG TPA: hypothetical protein [Caudoviricetes sp.]